MEAGTFDERPSVLAVRMRAISEAVKELIDWRRDVDVDRATTTDQLHEVAADVKALASDVADLRKVLIAFAFTIAGSSVVFALSVLIATGRIK